MGAVFAGFVAGILCFQSLVRWAAVFIFAYSALAVTQPPNRLSRAIRLGLCESVFHSTPWFLATLAFIAYEIRGESFAIPLYTGFVITLGAMGAFVIRTIVAMRRRRVPS